MGNLKYNLVSFNGEETLTVFGEGRAYVATNTHPYWYEIKRLAVVEGDPSVVDLIDPVRKVAKEFQRLGEQVTYTNGVLYFDGDPVNNAIAKKIIEFVEAGVEDWKPLVLFMQKVFANPNEHSREQLFEWMTRHRFAINEEGDILGYKSVQSTTQDGFTYESITAGDDTVTVDGKEYTGNVPQNVGSVVEMSRSAVEFDPSNGCSNGLHVANFRYASTWTWADGRTVLLVAMNPRDVVSVPTESNFEKVRCCRYRVVKVVDREVDDALMIEAPKPEPVATPGTYTLGGPLTASGLTVTVPVVSTWDDDDDDEDDDSWDDDEDSWGFSGSW